MPSLLTASLAALLLSSAVHALKLDFRVRTAAGPVSRRALAARTDKSVLPVHNTHNAEYIANITLGGRDIPVLLDTGRCVPAPARSLWVFD